MPVLLLVWMAGLLWLYLGCLPVPCVCAVGIVGSLFVPRAGVIAVLGLGTAAAALVAADAAAAAVVFATADDAVAAALAAAGHLLLLLLWAGSQDPAPPQDEALG